MQTVTGSSEHHGPESEYRARRMARLLAILLALLALGFGVAGLWSLSAEAWGIGLIAFGCLLALISLLAQAAEHFGRASATHTQRRTER